MNIKIPKIYEPLFRPNHTREELAKFTDSYKASLRKRILAGEELDLSAIGLKTFVLYGGRSSGKTKNDEYSTAELFFGKPGDIWYCRSEQADIRLSIFQSLQSTLFSMGFTLSDHKSTDFKVTRSPYEIICNRTGNRCQFLAINKDINRTKGYEPPTGRLKKVILEEANEPDSKIYVEALKSTALRFCDEESKLVFRYNPPPNLRHWANDYYPRLIREGAEGIRSTWRDISDFLEPTQIADILELKENDPVHYAYWYEGEILNLEGRVIWSFDRNKHLISLAELQRKIVKDIFYQPVCMFYGVDSGLKRDATVVSAWGLYPDGRLIKLSTLYIKINEYLRKTGLNGLSHSDQAVLVAEWHEKFKIKMQDWGINIPDKVCERWCFDGAALTQDLMLEFRKLTGFNCIPVTNKDVERDIARLVNAYRSGKLIVLDIEDNQPSIIEYETFVRDEEGKIGEGQDDHSIDADKYATYDYYYNF